MERAEKKQLREYIGQHVDLSGMRLTDRDATFLKDLIDSWDEYRGRSRTQSSTWRGWSSEGRYSRTQEDTDTFTDEIGIRRSFKFKDDDGHSGEGFTEIGDVHGLIDWFREVWPTVRDTFEAAPECEEAPTLMLPRRATPSATSEPGFGSASESEADVTEAESGDGHVARNVALVLSVGAVVAAVVAAPSVARWMRGTASPTVARTWRRVIRRPEPIPEPKTAETTRQREQRPSA